MEKKQKRKVNTIYNYIKRYKIEKFEDIEVIIIKNHDNIFNEVVHSFYMKEENYGHLMFMFGIKNKEYQKLKREKGIKTFLLNVINEYIEDFTKFIIK